MKFSYKIVLIILAIVIAFGGVVALYFGGVYNNTISYEESITTAQSNITIQEKRRADLIPNLVDCVKAYDQHEYETLKDIIAERGIEDSSAEVIQTKVTAIAESYPELKSDNNYKELMNELSRTENSIAEYRENYNFFVKTYNEYIRKFPHNIVLNLFNYEKINFVYLDYENVEEAPTNLFE